MVPQLFDMTGWDWCGARGGGTDDLTSLLQTILWGQFDSIVCRETILQRRREEYRDMVPQLFDMTGRESLRGEDEATALRQVCLVGSLHATQMKQQGSACPDLCGPAQGAHVCVRLTHCRLSADSLWGTLGMHSLLYAVSVANIVQPVSSKHAVKRISSLLRSASCFTMLALQVQVDAPRTAPEVPFFSQPAMQAALQRVLYLWGIRCCLWHFQTLDGVA